MTKSSTSRHFSILTTPILNLRLPKITSPLILGNNCSLPPLPLPLHPLQMWVSLQAPCQIPQKKHLFFSPHIHLTNQGNSLPQFQILHQVTLPGLNPNTYQNIIQLNYLQTKLHQIFIPPQESTLPVEIPHACLIYPNLSNHHKNLPHLLFLHQIFTIPVEIPQSYHILSHMTSQWRSLTQLHHLHQITLTVEISSYSHKQKQKNNPLLLSPQQNSPRFAITTPYDS